ncbi:MAG: hypothetical protein ACK53W_02110 [Gemmatimonadota bacterium]
MFAPPWPPAAVAAPLAVLAAWTTWCGGTVARVPSAGPLHRGLAGLAALLVLPAAIVALALGGAETSTIVREGAWLWPLTCAAALPQPLAALRRNRAAAWLVAPVAGWNVVAMLDAAARSTDALGLVVPDALVPLLHAPRAAWTRVLGPEALVAAWVLWIPLLVPLWPPRSRFARVAHALLALVAGTGLGATVVGGMGLVPLPASYARFGAEPPRERPAGDFDVGVGILPTVLETPPAAVARLDASALSLLEVTALHVEVSARAARSALDSLGRILEPHRLNGGAIVVTLRDLPAEGPADSLAVAVVAQRTAATTIVVSGPWETVPVVRLAPRVARRAAAARLAGRRGVQVAVAVSATDGRRHAWAADPASGVDEIVLLLEPEPRGAAGLVRQLATWSAWIAETASARRYWLRGSGAVPAAHGARSQRQAVRGVLAWATSEPRVRGAIVADATDHGSLDGLRTAARLWRPGAGTVLQAGRSIRETRLPVAAPAPVDTAPP